MFFCSAFHCRENILCIPKYGIKGWRANTFTSNNENISSVSLGIGGMALTAVGIPLWAVNASRKNEIEFALIKFNTTSFSGNNQPTYFGYKQPSALGLNVKIKF